jgi:hypothetical protein
MRSLVQEVFDSYPDFFQGDPRYWIDLPVSSPDWEYFWGVFVEATKPTVTYAELDWCMRFNRREMIGFIWR